MLAALALRHGSGSDVLGWLLRGFASSAGWMLARGLGLPVSLIVTAAFAFWYWHRARTRRRVARGDS